MGERPPPLVDDGGAGMQQGHERPWICPASRGQVRCGRQSISRPPADLGAKITGGEMPACSASTGARSPGAERPHRFPETGSPGVQVSWRTSICGACPALRPNSPWPCRGHCCSGPWSVTRCTGRGLHPDRSMFCRRKRRPRVCLDAACVPVNVAGVTPAELISLCRPMHWHTEQALIPIRPQPTVTR